MPGKPMYGLEFRVVHGRFRNTGKQIVFYSSCLPGFEKKCYTVIYPHPGPAMPDKPVKLVIYYLALLNRNRSLRLGCSMRVTS